MLPRPFRWQPGRRGGGYRKLLLAHGRTWDLYLLDYPRDTFLLDHTDPVEGHRHHRLNVVLLGALDAFGAYGTDHVRKWLRGRIVVFRPDLVTHWVELCQRRRVVLSFGWVTPEAPRRPGACD